MNFYGTFPPIVGTYPTMPGLSFGISQGRVNYWVHRLVPVGQMSLSELGMKAEREGERGAGFSSASWWRSEFES